MAEQWYQNLYEYSPFPIEIYDGEGRLKQVNSACLDLFGVDSVKEIENFKLFEDPNIPSEEKAKLREGKTVQYASEFDFELVKKFNLYKTSKSGKIFIEVLIKPLFFEVEMKTPSNYAVYIQDISTRKKSDMEKSNLMKILQDKAKEKEILLKEIHHRVKNNLQVISSLVILQQQSIKDPEFQKYFTDFLNRVKSISLNHEFLFKSKDLGKIDFNTYVKKLSQNIIDTYDHQKIDLKINIQEIYLDIKVAQACGLILNELVTNSLKYAFPDKKGNIEITLTQLENGLKELSVKDNGIGIASFTDIQQVKSLGMRLVVNLAKQINGTIEILSHEGTEIIIRFKNP